VGKTAGTPVMAMMPASLRVIHGKKKMAEARDVP
jgi:hypothetical protein